VRSLKQLVLAQAKAWAYVGVLTVPLALTLGVSAQDKPQTPPAEKPAPPTTRADEPPIVTHHEMRIGGRALKYTATTGFLPIKSATGDVEARLFFMAYTLDDAGDAAKRPLMFSFNGGPGSSSVWLHLGALGPRRVKMRPDGGMPAAPYELVDNDQSWLDRTDLVFIDPVGTGYSRPAKPELGSKFWTLDGDIQSVGEFIRLYLTRYRRWASPLFLVGESYGTTRAAGLAGQLIDRGIAFNGIVLVSSILNFQTAEFNKGNDLPYALFLPTYTATAWYHQRLAPELQKDLRTTLSEAEAFASGRYVEALSRGDRLPADRRQAIARDVARFTGLSIEYVEQSNLRIEIQRFCKELLRREGRTVGRLDSRFTGFDELGVTSEPEFDPSLAAIRPPYTAMFQQYVTGELGFSSDEPYHILGGGFTQWNWNRDNGFVDTSEALRRAFVRNPYMRLFVASGYYDLATPYFATVYTLSHLGLHPALTDRITTGEYAAGHMMYIDVGELAKLRRDVAAFIDLSLERTDRPAPAIAPGGRSSDANIR
jgi:carboxypeptidase C (cathepsin A)